MNSDSFADVGRRIARTNETTTSYGGVETTRRRGPTVAQWLVSLAVALAVAWAVAYAVPAFGGLFAVGALGFVVLLLVPWLVVSGVARALEAAE